MLVHHHPTYAAQPRPLGQKATAGKGSEAVTESAKSDSYVQHAGDDPGLVPPPRPEERERASCDWACGALGAAVVASGAVLGQPLLLAGSLGLGVMGLAMAATYLAREIGGDAPADWFTDPGNPANPASPLYNTSPIYSGGLSF